MIRAEDRDLIPILLREKSPEEQTIFFLCYNNKLRRFNEYNSKK